MSVTGEPDGRPTKMAVAVIDVLAGKDAAIAILAGLAGRRQQPPQDRHLVITLGGSALAALVNVAQNALVSGREAARWGNAHANLVPYQLFETADRPMVIAVGSDAQWRALTGVLGDESLQADETLGTNAGRVTQRSRCVDAVQRVLRSGTAANWTSMCERVGVPVGQVRSVLEALAGSGASPLTGVPSSVGGGCFCRHRSSASTPRKSVVTGGGTGELRQNRLFSRCRVCDPVPLSVVKSVPWEHSSCRIGSCGGDRTVVIVRLCKLPHKHYRLILPSRRTSTPDPLPACWRVTERPSRSW